MKIFNPDIQQTPCSLAFYHFPHVLAIVFSMDLDKDLDGLEKDPHVWNERLMSGKITYHFIHGCLYLWSHEIERVENGVR